MQNVKEQIQNRWQRTNERVKGQLQRLSGAWDGAATAVRRRLSVPSGADIKKLTAHVHELASRGNRLAREQVARVQERVARLRKR